MTSLRPILVLAIFCAAFAATSAHAQNRPLEQAIRHGWVKCGVVGGRVHLRLNVGNGSVESSVANLLHPETLSIHNENGRFSLAYSRKSAVEQLTMRADKSDELSIRREPRGDSKKPLAEFSQKSGEKLVFSVGTADKPKKFHASNLWLLLMIPAKQDRAELISLLELFHPDWKLAETAAGIEARMVEDAAAEGNVQRSRWTDLVARLGDDDFAKREAADRDLRAGGPGAVNFLRQLDFSRLDAEQQFRVRRILDSSVEQNEDDSVEQAASLLAAEPLAWLALASRPEKATRATAVRQLSNLLGEPVAIDPTADPDSQKEQREKVLAKLEAR